MHEQRAGTHCAIVPPTIIAAVVGPRGSGKTSTVSSIIALLSADGLRVEGVTQPGIHNAETMERVGYDIRDVATREARPFARLASRPTANGLRYEFDDEAWKWAAARVAAARTHAQVLVVDELGKMEAEGGGHMPGLLRGGTSGPGDTHPRGQLWLLTVRAECRDRIEAQLGSFALVLQVSGDHALTHAEIVHFSQRCIGLVRAQAPS